MRLMILLFNLLGGMHSSVDQLTALLPLPLIKLKVTINMGQ
jgi:hypothetical protein